MTKKERAAYIGKDLKKKFPKPPIPLTHKDPYTLLVAVLLSAQCTDVRVNKITPALWKLADNPHDMAKQPVTKIREIIRPCGLSPTKSKNIKALSQILVNEYDGIVPADLALLETLPGVGHKTASVVMIQIFNTPAFPVDTHIHRLATKWKLTSGRNVKTTEKDLKRLYPEKDWADLHLQFIYYGREYCQARGCDGKRCEMCQTIFANKNQ